MNQSNVMSPEQMRALVERLSQEDKARVGEELRKCSGEVLVFRGIPTTIAILGGLHYARSTLPTPLQSGPRRWIFGSFLAAGAFTMTNILFGNPCFERLQPLMADLEKKYNDPSFSAPSSRYNELRNANRGTHSSLPPSATYRQVSTNLDSTKLYDDAQSRQAPKGSFREQASDLASQPQPFMRFEDNKPYVMSGTPISSEKQFDNSSARLSSDASGGKSTKYGDVDFS